MDEMNSNVEDADRERREDACEPAEPPAPPSIVPTFLTREEYEQVGDDPEPLPQGFEVIEGGAGTRQIDTEAIAAEPEGDAAQPLAADGGGAPDGADEPGGPGAAAAVGSFISEGMDAVREVSAAKRAHASARDLLEQLTRSIEDEQAELDHRRDIAARFEQIVADESRRRDSALAEAGAADARAEEHAALAAELKRRLQDMRDEDAQTEKRLRAAADAAEAKEASSREGAARLQRRLDDAKRAVDRASQERDSALEAARSAIDSAAERLSTLREEYADLQRNPSANSAVYSVRSNELQIEISDAAGELRAAQDALPAISDEVERAVKTAEALLADAKKPIEGAKRAHLEVTAEADDARDALDSAKTAAAERQKQLRDQISAQEREVKAQERAAADARATADDAQALIDEAIEIHEHPEQTEAIAADLERNRAEHAEQEAEVDQLAEMERDVRERTRESRLRFLGAIAAIVAVIAIALAAWFALT